MTYETMDWEAEARRIEAAFNIHAPSHFLEYKTGYVLALATEPVADQDILIDLGDGVGLSVYYESGLKVYFDLYTDGGRENAVGISFRIRESGWAFRSLVVEDQQLAPILMKAMCFLGHDIDFLEEEFQIGLTSHERVEWTLEYDARLNAQNVK